MKQYLYAIAMFVGTTIGVGLFGLPYVASKTGYLPVLIYFGILGLLTLLIQLAYGEITLRTHGEHRLPGYTKIYLGPKAKAVPLFSNLIGMYGANIAYLIVGGGFLSSLLTPIFGGNQLLYTLIFFGVGSLIVFLGTRTIATSEFFSLILFFIVLATLFLYGLPKIEILNLTTFEPSQLFLPYGVILFAMGGMSIIPETKEILGKKLNLLKSVIIIGTLLPIITYIVFITLITGISGSHTTPDGLSGLEDILGPQVLIYGYVFGIITTFTSYLTLSLTIKKIYIYDMKVPKLSAWVITAFIPLFFYIAGFDNFIKIIAFTGALTTGIDGILVILLFLKAKKNGKRRPEYTITLLRPIIYAITGLFLLGVFLSLFPGQS